MPVSFKLIQVGQTYSRKALAEMWGYAGYEALTRGVVTPREDDKIILFVTADKQECMEPYADVLHGSTLDWEGPTDHYAEQRMIDAAKTGEQIHLFFRPRHHMDFTYCGQLEVVAVERFAVRPSQFRFQVKG